MFLEQTGDVVSLLVWAAFGALAAPIMLARIDALPLMAERHH